MITIPPLSNGLCYGFDHEHRRVCTGARMGRANILPAFSDLAGTPFSLRRLKFVDGAYDEGGAYWGAPANVYRAVTVTSHVWRSNWDGRLMDDLLPLEIFVRAANRADAKQKVLAILPGAQFYR